MFAALMTLALTMEGYEQADFVLEIHSNTPIEVYLGDTKLIPGKVYRTKDRLLTEREVELEIRYINGDKVIKQKITAPLVPGKKTTWTIELETNPPSLFYG